MTRKLRIKHTIIDWLRWTGIRDRMRCPACNAVGTWKNHGGRFDHHDRRRVKRWLCKWCGYYVGPEGERLATIDAHRREWTLPEDLSAGELGMTPHDALRASPIPNAWPWRG